MGVGNDPKRLTTRVTFQGFFIGLDPDMVDGGWTLRHRKRWKHEYMRDILTVVMIEYFIDNAAWENITKEFGSPLRVFKLKRGQLVYSQIELANWFGIDRQRIRTRQGFLEKAGFLTSLKTRGYTVISVINYNKYQTWPKGEKPEQKPPSNHHLTTHPLKEYNKYNNARARGGDKNADEKERIRIAKSAKDRIRVTEKAYLDKINIKNLAVTAKAPAALKSMLRAKAKDHETKN